MEIETQGLHISSGKQGEGKTLFMVSLLKSDLETYPNRKVFSNIWLDVPHEKITFDREIDGENHIDILEKINTDPTYFNNSIMFIDEIHLYVDSYNFMGKNNKVLQKFISQLRKRNILILATTQYFSQVDIRIRAHTRYLFKMKKITPSKYKAEVHIPERHDSEYVKTINIENMNKYFNCYNTNEVVE